jgi:hypothetical protein
MGAITNDVIDFKSRRLELENETKFLGLLDKEFDTAKPIPSSVFDRIAKVKHQAFLARQRHEMLEM